MKAWKYDIFKKEDAMSFERAIEHGKEKRKQYRNSKRFDASCRNHGGCPACESNRKPKPKHNRDYSYNLNVKLNISKIRGG